MITFFAPASRCLAAASRLVKIPVDSTTTSTPRSFHGNVAGSRTARPLNPLPSTTMSSSVDDTSYGSRPRIESYFSRCASDLLSVMSFTADDLDVRRPRHVLRVHRPPEVAADPPEPVHAYPDRHVSLAPQDYSSIHRARAAGCRIPVAAGTVQQTRRSRRRSTPGERARDRVTTTVRTTRTTGQRERSLPDAAQHCDPPQGWAENHPGPRGRRGAKECRWPNRGSWASSWPAARANGSPR